MSLTYKCFYFKKLLLCYCVDINGNNTCIFWKTNGSSESRIFLKMENYKNLWLLTYRISKWSAYPFIFFLANTIRLLKLFSKLDRHSFSLWSLFLLRALSVFLFMIPLYYVHLLKLCCYLSLRIFFCTKSWPLRSHVLFVFPIPSIIFIT